MRIAHLMAGAPVGGAELFFERLCAAQHEAGDAVLAMVRGDPGRLARLRASGLAPVAIRFTGGLAPLTRAGIARRLRRFRPEVAIAWMGRAAAAAPRGDWVLAGRLGGRYDLSRFARCRDLIANTEGLVRWIVAEGWPAARVHHLPNFSPDLAGAEPDRGGLPTSVPLVLALGRLHPNKGFDLLIEAIALCPGVHLDLAGDGPERSRLQALASARGVAGRVRFLGWRQDQARLLAGCDLLCCPSRIEPLGNVVLEAFSAGRPVIAAEADGPRELIEHGRTGLLVAREEPRALAGAISDLLADRTRAGRLAAGGRAAYEARHAPASVLARWRATLGRLVAEGAA